MPISARVRAVLEFQLVQRHALIQIVTIRDCPLSFGENAFYDAGAIESPYFKFALIECRFTVHENHSPSREHRVGHYFHGFIDHGRCAGFTNNMKYRN